jgi:hypothetical protein
VVAELIDPFAAQASQHNRVRAEPGGEAEHRCECHHHSLRHDETAGEVEVGSHPRVEQRPCGCQPWPSERSAASNMEQLC